jgi:phosphoacetylglucosamine mutase
MSGFDSVAIKENIIPHEKKGFVYTYGTAGFRSK